MKSVFYKRLLYDKTLDLSPCKKIVYSYLVYHSICYMWGDVINKEDNNTFDLSLLQDKGDTFELPYFMFNNQGRFWYANKMSTDCGINQSTISRTISELENKGLIATEYDYHVVYHSNIYDDGYFTLLSDTGFESALLIFFSWLCNLKGSKEFIYANNKTLSELFFVVVNRWSEQAIANYIHRLTKMGFVKRDEYKRLRILKLTNNE